MLPIDNVKSGVRTHRSSGGAAQRSTQENPQTQADHHLRATAQIYERFET